MFTLSLEEIRHVGRWIVGGCTIIQLGHLASESLCAPPPRHQGRNILFGTLPMTALLGHYALSTLGISLIFRAQEAPKFEGSLRRA
jgi:hypothetical protein